MSNNRSNRNDNARNDYSRSDNDSFGGSSRSGRGGSWSNRDDAESMHNSRGGYDRDMNDRMETGQSSTSAYGDEQSMSRDRYRNNQQSRGSQGDRNNMNDRGMSNRSNADMGADSWGGNADRDTGRDRYSTRDNNADDESRRNDYYGNRSINQDRSDSQADGDGYRTRGSRDGNDRYGMNSQRNDRDQYSWGGQSSMSSYGSTQYGGQSEPDYSNYNARPGSYGGAEDSYGSRNRNDMDGLRSNRSQSQQSGESNRGYSDRYSGRQGGSNEFSSWQNSPSDMRPQQNSQWGARSGMQSGSQFGSQSGMQQGQHAGRGPKGYRRDDARITEDVNEKLTHDAHIDASEIEVKVSGGEVTLTGTVDSREAKRHAEDLAEMVSGVNNVTNHIRVSKNNNDRNSNSFGSAHADEERMNLARSTGSTHDRDMEREYNEEASKSESKRSSKSGASSTPDAAMSHAAGTGPSGAANTSVTANNTSGKPSPNTSGASTQRSGDRGAS